MSMEIFTINMHMLLMRDVSSANKMNENMFILHEILLATVKISAPLKL